MHRPTEPQDFELHRVYLLDVDDESVAEYLPRQTERDEGRIGPTYEEWKALFFDVLHADTGPLIGYRMEGSTVVPFVANPIEFVGNIAGHPMLSKIKGRIYDATYTRPEVQQLREECAKLKASFGNPKAVVALAKLISICDLAIERNAAVLLAGD